MKNEKLLNAGAYARFTKTNSVNTNATIFTELNAAFNNKYNELNKKLEIIINTYNKFCDDMIKEEDKDILKIDIDTDKNITYKQELENIKDEIDPTLLKENLLVSLTNIREDLVKLEKEWVE